MPRLVDSSPQLPPALSFGPVLRSIDSSQSLQNFTANNSTSVSASSPQVISVRINTSKWLNPLSSYFMFDLTLQHTLGTAAGTLKDGVASCFRSLTILSNGVVIEQIREHHILSRIVALSQTSPASTSNWDTGYEATATRAQTAVGGAVTTARSYTIQPLSGFLSNMELIPMWAMGELEIRLELNTGAEALLNITNSTELTAPDFTISSFKYVAELHDLPGSFNRLVQDVVNEGGLAYKIGTYDTVTYNIQTATENTTTISNNAKSVKSIFAVQRAAAEISADATTTEYSFITDNLQSTQLLVGGQHYPLEAMPVGAQSWKELVKSVQREGHYSSNFDIAQDEYRGTATPGIEGGQKFVVGMDLEKFCGGDLICGTDFSENDISFRTIYSSSPTTANRWYFFIYKDAQVTILPGYSVLVNS